MFSFPPTNKLLFTSGEACRPIPTFMNGIEPAVFLAAAKTQSAVSHEAAIIGEAVKALPDEGKQAHPSIPSKRIAGMRDRLVPHDFNGEIETRWKTAAENTPAPFAELCPFAFPFFTEKATTPRFASLVSTARDRQRKFLLGLAVFE